MSVPWLCRLPVDLLCLGGRWSLSDNLVNKRIPSPRKLFCKKALTFLKVCPACLPISSVPHRLTSSPCDQQLTSELNGLFRNTAKCLSRHVFWWLKAPNIYNAPFPNSGQPEKLRSGAFSFAKFSEMDTMHTSVISSVASTFAPLYNRCELTEATANNQVLTYKVESGLAFPHALCSSECVTQGKNYDLTSLSTCP